MNKVILTGRVVRDIERVLERDGKVLWTFSVAVNYSNDKDKVDFFDCEYWTDSGVEIDLNKGKLVMINGRLRQSRWEKDGKNLSRVVIVVKSLWGIESVRRYLEHSEPEIQVVNDDLPF